MNHKRIFIGSFTHHPLLYDFFDLTKKVLYETAIIKWTRTPKNLHFTLHFFGEMPVKKIQLLQRIMIGILNRNYDIRFKITGLKYFKRKGKPAVLYAHIEDENGELKKLYLEIQNLLFQHGFIDQIKFSFVPHITFGRIKKVEPSFYEKITILNKDFEHIVVNNVCPVIIESVLSPEGALYRPLKI